jgi:AraC-like DNA-binding protein
MRERSSEELGSAVMADAAMLQAAILINRLRLKSVRSERRSRTGSLVSSVLEYINSHFSEELTLDNLAGRFFISKYHLSREFGRIVGIPLHRYITQKRLVAAKQMLSEGLPSSAVYQHCGFGDYSNFYRAFRGEYGISPKRYVSSLRTETDTAPGETQVFTQDAGDGILKKRQRNKKGNTL